jgi:hypothetical protein
MRFVIDKSAARFIRERDGAVAIGLHLEPSLGGCPCAENNLTGSQIASISLGKPSSAEKDQYRFQAVEGVEVYFPPSLEVKQGSTEIRIRVRGFLWFRWLELEGARSVACYTRSEPAS